LPGWCNTLTARWPEEDGAMRPVPNRDSRPFPKE
jgi:hypothetical protein